MAFAKELCLVETKLLTRRELLLTCGATETVDVVDLEREGRGREGRVKERERERERERENSYTTLCII